MDDSGAGQLATQLRMAPTPAVSGLPDEHQAHLATAIRGARRHQAEQLAAASEQALEHIPRLLRGPVRKIVG